MTENLDREVGFLHASLADQQKQLDKVEEKGDERKKSIDAVVLSLSKLEARVSRLEWILGAATTILGYIVTQISGLWHLLFSGGGHDAAAGVGVAGASASTVWFNFKNKKPKREGTEEGIPVPAPTQTGETTRYSIILLGLFMIAASGVSIYFYPLSIRDQDIDNDFTKGPPPLNPTTVTMKCVDDQLIVHAIPHPNKDVKCTAATEVYRYWRFKDNTLELAYAVKSSNRPTGAHFSLTEVDPFMPADVVFNIHEIPDEAVDFVTVLSSPEGACSSPFPGIPGFWGSVRLSQNALPEECLAKIRYHPDR